MRIPCARQSRAARSGRLADPIERQIEFALRPGEFIGDRA
jgi:hypothetical protein